MFTNPALATVTIFAGNFAPLGWAYCNGQLLAISQYNALFALLGTTYGGDGQNTFALPDLRGRVPISPGQGPGLSNFILGQLGGFESVTLNNTNLPAHTHTATATGSPGASSANGTTDSPVNNVAAAIPNLNQYNTAGGAKLKSMTASELTGVSGSNQPISIRQPYLCMNYIICTEGIFPTQF